MLQITMTVTTKKQALAILEAYAQDPERDEKPAPVAKTKPAPVAKPAQEPVQEPIAAVKGGAPVAELEVTSDAPSYAETSKALVAYMSKHGRDAAVALLTAFNAAKLTDIPPSNYAAVIQACGKP